MNGVAAIVGLAVLEYMIFGVLVGRARGTYHIPAPATTGDPTFERYFRVHQNSMEALIVFIPSLLLFAYYVSVSLAIAIGLIFLVGRIIYGTGYITAPEKRGPGAMITFSVNAILVLGAIVGPIVHHFRVH
jgi:glutathione S-transferase